MDQINPILYLKADFYDKKLLKNLNINKLEYIPQLGLLNKRNFCYANSALQLLLSLHLFRNEILQINVDQGISRELKKLFTFSSITSNSKYDPSHIYETVNRIQETLKQTKFGTQQQDMSDFLLWTFSQITEEIGTKVHFSNPVTLKDRIFAIQNKKSFIDDIFGIGRVSAVNCKKCNFEKEEPILEHQLILNIKNDQLLTSRTIDFSSIIALTFGEDINPDRKCENCNQTGSVSTSQFILFLPPVLLLIVNRAGHAEKIKDFIEIPTYVDLQGYYHKDSEISKSIIFELSSFIVHQGNTQKSGHYYSMFYTKENLYEANDSRITKLNHSEFNDYYNKNCTMLCYKMKKDHR